VSEKEKNLFDFVDLSRFGRTLKKNAPTVSEKQKESPYRPGDKILFLGCGDLEELRRIRECGAECLGVSDLEAEVVAARKAGIRAVLSNAEYLEDRDRFDWVILENPHYRLHDPGRALRRMIRSLRPGGKLRVEFPVSGNLSSMESAFDFVKETERFGKGMEKVFPPSKESCEKIFKATVTEDISVRFSFFYRSEILQTGQMASWLKRRLRDRIALLSPAERKQCLERIQKRMQERENTLYGGTVVVENVLARFHAEKKS